jgi:hypothetical protein
VVHRGNVALITKAPLATPLAPASLYSSAAPRKGLFLEIPHPPRRIPARPNEYQNKHHINHHTSSETQPK